MKDAFVVKKNNYPYKAGNSVPALCINAYTTLSTSKLTSQQKCQSSSMKVIKTRGMLWVQGGLTFIPRGYPLNITVWLTWKLSNLITSQYRNWKDVPRKDLIIVAFFSCSFLCFHCCCFQKEDTWKDFCWGIVALLLQLCFDTDDSVQVSDSDLCRSQFPLSTLCLSWLIWL